ncbi:MAG: hypothetical protein ACJ79H_03525 [Myxococcales bacterium]
MNYRLVVLTSPPGDTLGRTLASVAEHVHPAPAEVNVVADGYQPTVEAMRELGFPGPIPLLALEPARGFCGATYASWSVGALTRLDYTLYLEHDFLFRHPVDLRELAFVLDTYPQLAQMQFMRDAANEKERAAGGLFESRPGEYQARSTFFDRFRGDPGKLDTPHDLYERPWLEHHSYLTTNPSLMRSAFMREHPWPDYPEQCEGRFGIDLVRAGYSFGVWGSGEPWVHHIGERHGFGY